MERLKVVLFEPDRTYRSNIATFLESHGCVISIVETVTDINEQTRNPEWVIYLLNLKTTGNWGIAFLAASEARHECPVVVLSDNDDDIDRIVTLELGADDYIMKTAHHREILARIRVAQRRGLAGRQPNIPARPVMIAKAPAGW